MFQGAKEGDKLVPVVLTDEQHFFIYASSAFVDPTVHADRLHLRILPLLSERLHS